MKMRIVPSEELTTKTLRARDYLGIKKIKGHSMRNHVALCHLSKERDYILMESRCFFGELAPCLAFLNEIAKGAWHGDAQRLLGELRSTIESRDVRKFEGLLEQARRLVWQYNGSIWSREFDFLLMFLSFLNASFFALSREPESYDNSLRPADLQV